MDESGIVSVGPSGGGLFVAVNNERTQGGGEVRW